LAAEVIRRVQEVLRGTRCIDTKESEIRSRRQVMRRILSWLALAALVSTYCFAGTQEATSALASGSGLYAEYRELYGSTVIKTVDGEGPILHGYSWDCYYAGQGITIYQGQCGLWAGTWDGWGRFEETLTGYIEATQTGPYTISGTTDDDHVVTFQDQIVSEYHGSYGWFVFTADLVAGQFYKIQIDYKNKGGSNWLNLAWEGPDGVCEEIPKEYLYTDIPFVVVGIDIKPGSFPNTINLGAQGLLPVAILGSAEFDVETIDPETVNVGGVSLALRGSAKAPKLAYSYEDVNGDGVTDLMAFFDLQVLVTQQVLTETTGALEISGSLYDGTSIKGMDSVNIVH
jgi:hypothetical protein